LVRGPKLLLDAWKFITGVPSSNGFNSRPRKVTALLVARIGSPRQKKGKLPNAQSSIIGLHKD
ncbi:hypothetical protein A2U01_0097842, partial [Trifolium medium]|nr:hypothetical protein [Trifolium medium]